LRYFAARATPTMRTGRPLTCIERPTGSAPRQNCAAIVSSPIATRAAVSSSARWNSWPAVRAIPIVWKKPGPTALKSADGCRSAGAS